MAARHPRVRRLGSIGFLFVSVPGFAPWSLAGRAHEPVGEVELHAVCDGRPRTIKVSGSFGWPVGITLDRDRCFLRVPCPDFLCPVTNWFRSELRHLDIRRAGIGC
jgi:hypothetical protein